MGNEIKRQELILEITERLEDLRESLDLSEDIEEIESLQRTIDANIKMLMCLNYDPNEIKMTRGKNLLH